MFQEMIYDLCQLTQDFLGSLNKKPIYSEHENMLKTTADKEIEKKVEKFNINFLIIFLEN